MTHKAEVILVALRLGGITRFESAVSVCLNLCGTLWLICVQDCATK